MHVCESHALRMLNSICRSMRPVCLSSNTPTKNRMRASNPECCSFSRASATLDAVTQPVTSATSIQHRCIMYFAANKIWWGVEACMTINRICCTGIGCAAQVRVWGIDAYVLCATSPLTDYISVAEKSNPSRRKVSDTLIVLLDGSQKLWDCQDTKWTLW